MASKSPQVILDELDRLLEETSWKGPPSDLSYLADPAHLQAFQEAVLGGAYHNTMAQWILKQVEQSLGALGEKGTFRVCSVGCGDGTLDKEIIGGLAAAHPGLAIEYVGVGLCEQGCEEVEGEMEDVGENVVVQVVAKDYSELSKDEVGTFDCVLMVSCLCYSTVPEAMLRAVLGLLEPAGELIVVSSSQKLVDELIGRFWKHQRHYDLCTSEKVKAMLQEVGNQYSVQQLPVAFDLGQCFSEGFKSVKSKLFLDHIMQVNLEEYAPAVSGLVIDFLGTIAIGPSEKRAVESVSDMIIIKPVL